MTSHSYNKQAPFCLKPVQAARVSEISEITIAAGVSSEESINFHIGNPVQDARLSSAFLRIALGIDVHREDLSDADPDAVLEHLGWDASDKADLEFIIRLIQKCSNYTPRGGFSRKSPNALVKTFCSWLEHQQEALHYNIGDQSGRREIILASGGTIEALRLVLFALSSSLEFSPNRVLCYRYELLPQLKAIPNFLFEDLSADERVAYQQVKQFFEEEPQLPAFLLIGDALGEETRRKLRLLSIERPLFFIEANNAPNHASLAREAKLVQRVIRLLTPGIFAPQLDALSTVFIIGNADFLDVIENVQFNLKGTPSASEIEFLTLLLEQKLYGRKEDSRADVPQVRPSSEGLALGTEAESALPRLAERVEADLEHLLDQHAQAAVHSLTTIEEKANLFSQRIRLAWKDKIFDEFSAVGAKELLDLLVQNVDDQTWCAALQRSFLSAFVRHQPQYQPEACLIVSGSARTALGILGFHCGITEAVIPDLSWCYEQCITTVHAVPLTAALELDVDAMIQKVEELCWQDPSWKKRGAVVINNPHNGTGRVFDEEMVRRLIKYCLQHDLFVVDDLAYQNMAPVDGLPEFKTVRQIAAELVRLSLVDESQANRVITVHSMSKADSLAGARLAVVEIRDPEMRRRFEELNSKIQPNLAAIFLCYLFYRGTTQDGRTYWHLRNSIFQDRMQALLTALENLPPDRNPFGITILPPTGSMYPLLQIARLPAGLSLDWLASSLARRGIGLMPLSTFARTEKGYETGRSIFRLTLGGVDGAEVLKVKTRRLLIALNRLIAEEAAGYNRKQLPCRFLPGSSSRSAELSYSWEAVVKQIFQQGESDHLLRRMQIPSSLDGKSMQAEFLRQYAPERLQVFRTRLFDRALCSEEAIRRALSDSGEWLGLRLEREFMKDSLRRRQELFGSRSYDRTVHPTQMYSLQAEMALDAIITALIAHQPIPPGQIGQAVQELFREYLGRNVVITSEQEADEILLDLGTLIVGEEYTRLFTDTTLTPFLSFWSDWDGSNRPSGQGHRLAAAVVMENVRRMNRILGLLREADPSLAVNPELLSELDMLPQRSRHFTQLLNDITLLTHQLEQRYRGILPFSLDVTPFQRLATQWHLRRDPVRILWQHNDRYERKMLELRQQRRKMLEYYFSLNKQLRKQLYALIPAIQNNRLSERLLREVVSYRDILQRIVVTPRIQQGLITARDQFAIDTTAYNIYELNAIAGEYSNPGMVLAIQVSLSAKPEALISLDRKMRTQEEQVLREHPAVELPRIQLIPLFEDLDSVHNIRSYLDRLWDYAMQSRQTAQSAQNRFAEISSEIFIAGSDLSQQVSQATGAFSYLKAKYDVQMWLAEHGVSEVVRIKLGSGETMQRQGGYYARVAGQPAFLNSEENKRRFSSHLPAAGRKSTAYAVTPLLGVFLGGDLRTFQSNLSEQLRFLPVRDFASLLYHVRESQRNHHSELVRAAETITESRLGIHSQSNQELERLTIGTRDAPYYEEFLEELTSNFRQILYGREEDVIGIHIISYFIGRSIPQLRDRPTSRRTAGTGGDRRQRILANIAEIIPLAKQGSLLRAIVHNQAQTVVLGVNQLTTGLFRAIERFAQKSFAEAEREEMIAERLLPHLPIYEILGTLRIYQDWRGEFLKHIETAFPAGNSAYVALREDSDSMQRYLPMFQRELLRRHGLDVSDFFTNGVFIPNLLPALRPDLAVLLQKNLFNTEIELLLENVSGRIDDGWRAEVTRLLDLVEQIHHWRSVIWEVIGESIFQRVQSFTELATALYSFSSSQSFEATLTAGGGAKLPPAMTGFIRTSRADDEMRNFLLGAIEYLSSFAEGNIEVPVSIIRAMNDIERIAQIEESALPVEMQDLIRYCILQIARLAVENG